MADEDGDGGKDQNLCPVAFQTLKDAVNFSFRVDERTRVVLKTSSSIYNTCRC